MLPMSQGHGPVLPVTQCLKIVDLYILFSFLVFCFVFFFQHKDKLNAVFCVMARSRRQAGAMTIMVLKQGLPTVVAQWNPLRNFFFFSSGAPDYAFTCSPGPEGTAKVQKQSKVQHGVSTPYTVVVLSLFEAK